MVERIRIYGEEVLRKKSIDVKEINEEVLTILDNMVETNKEAGGVGLAGPQVGVNLNIFILDINDVVRKVINPEFLELSDDKVEVEEGCLSIPGVYKKVERSARVKIKYTTEDGEEVVEEAEGLLARAFQHEYDHLQGVLFVDKMGPVAKKLASNKLKKLKKLASKEKK